MSAKRNYAEMYTYDMKEGDKPLKVSTEFQGNCKSVNEYRKEFRIGEGTYGIVYRAIKPGTEEPVALKRIRMDHDSDGFPVSALREISILRNLKHENIVTVTDVVVANGLENVFMAMEYCEQDMAYLMDNVMSKDSSKAYSAAQVKCLQRQLLLGIEYLHENFIIHRDLKLSNLLLNRKGILKIADFGLARTFSDPPDPMTPKVITLWYRAPELLFGTSEYNTSIDIWSAGCIFGEFLISTPLLPGKTERDQLVLICELLGAPNTKIWPEIRKMPLYDEIRLPEIPYDSINSVFKNTSSATVSLLKGMLVYRPQERLSARKALQHRYFDERPLACNSAMLPTYPELRNKRKT